MAQEISGRQVQAPTFFSFTIQALEMPIVLPRFASDPPWRPGTSNGIPTRWLKLSKIDSKRLNKDALNYLLRSNPDPDLRIIQIDPGGPSLCSIVRKGTLPPPSTSAIAGWRVISRVTPILVAFLTGIVFGYLPARNAAHLGPIEGAGQGLVLLGRPDPNPSGTPMEGLIASMCFIFVTDVAQSHFMHFFPQRPQRTSASSAIY